MCFFVMNYAQLSEVKKGKIRSSVGCAERTMAEYIEYIYVKSNI